MLSTVKLIQVANVGPDSRIFSASEASALDQEVNIMGTVSLRIAGLVVVGAVVACAGRPCLAGFIDVDPNRSGTQFYSWAQGPMIVYLPAELTGADRMNFEMGIQAVAGMLREITSLEFRDGPPPAGAMTAVTVNIVDMVSGSDGFGLTTAGVPDPFPAGEDHVTIDSATIDLTTDALNQSNPGLMKNLGAHEIGHVLGLDDAPHQTPRVDVMDPKFTPDDPFVPLSGSDTMMLVGVYHLVPEPPTFVPCVIIGMLGLLGYGWRERLRLAGSRHRVRSPQ